MAFELKHLEELEISLIDGDRGKKYPKQSDFTCEGDCLFLSAKNVTKTGFEFEQLAFISFEKDAELRAGKIQVGDVIITTRGTIGNVAYYGESCQFKHVRINSGMIIVRANERRWNTKFLYFVLTSEIVKQQIDALTSGSAVPQFPARDIRKLLLPDVDKTIQDSIDIQLTALNEKITLNRRINQTLEQIAQALFKSWFVDFDPVVDNALDAGFFEQDLEFPDELLRRADARKSARESSYFKPLSNDIRQLFPAAFEKCSEPSLGLGGWIPSGWVVSTTGDEFTVKGGSTPSTANPKFWEGGNIHWTSPKDLSGSKEKIMLDTERKITCAGLNKITSGLLPSETVLMSSRAPIGYLALTKIPVAINQGYIAIPATKRLSQEYVLYWLISSIDEIKGIAGGTTFAEISKKTFKSISIVIPNTDVVDIFSGTTKGYLNKMTVNVVERAALEQLRDTLLPKLISGELRLSDSEVDTADEVVA